MKKITFILTVSYSLIYTANRAQGIHFSQYWMNNIQYNASLAGSMDGKLRANATYRNQWQANSPFTTYSAGLDTKVKASKNATIGIGGFFYSDVAGENRFVNNEGKLVLSSILNIANKHKFSLGVGGGVIQKNVDWMNGEWNEQYQNGAYNPSLSNQEQNNFNTSSSLRGDLSLGATYFFGLPVMDQTAPNPVQFSLGFSVNHLLSPSLQFHVFNEDKLYRNIIVHGDAKIQLSNPKIALLPSYFMQFQGPSREILFGSQLRYALSDPTEMSGIKRGSYLNIGTHLRLEDAFITSVGLQLDNYTVGISYDWNVNSAKRVNQLNGAFELNLLFELNSSKLNASYTEKE